MKKAVVITGTNGGIGEALWHKFSKEGYVIIGVDKEGDKHGCDHFISFDLAALSTSNVARERLFLELKELVSKYKIMALINNAAVQILGKLDNLDVNDFQETLSVNVLAPFTLSKYLARELEERSGAIINIGSIHSSLTKPGFAAYATSKGALEAMTRALAVEIGSRIRVNMISPAAIETEMLREGFTESPEAYQRLQSYHPSGCIGRPEDVADLAFFMVESKISFLNGAVINLDGGISACLSDPG